MKSQASQSVHYSNMILSVSLAAITPLLLQIRLILSNSIPDHPTNAKGVEQLKILLSPTIFFPIFSEGQGNSTKELYYIYYIIGQLLRLHTIQGCSAKNKKQTLNSIGLLFNLKTLLLAKAYGLIKKRTKRRTGTGSSSAVLGENTMD